MEETSDQEDMTVTNIKDQSRLPLLNLVEERKKSYTKPTIIRLDYKTRYNPSKKVNFLLKLSLILPIV